MVRSGLVTVAAAATALSAFAAIRFTSSLPQAAAAAPAPLNVPVGAATVAVDRLSASCRAVPVWDKAAFRDAFMSGRCTYLEQSGLTYTSGSFAGPNGRMPLLILSGRDRTFSRRVVVTLIGGPGGEVLQFGPREGVHPSDGNVPGNLFPLLEDLVRGGDVFVIPAYAGTMERSFYPHSDFPLAMRELEAFLRQTMARFPERRLILYGQSLGGSLAARLSPRFDSVPLVLHSPVLWKPRHFLAFTERTWDQPWPLRLAWAPRNIWPADGGRPPRREQVLAFDSTERFFGADLDNATVDDLRRSHAPATIVYSRRDARIGPEEMARLSRRPGLRVIEVGVDGHFVRTAREQQEMMAALATAFER